MSLNVAIHCPLPLVIRAVKRAKELGGYEERWPWPQAHPDRHSMQFVFPENAKGDVFFNEITRLMCCWENENEPDKEL